MRVYILGNYGSSANYAAVSYTNSIEYLTSSPNPNVLADGDSLLCQRLDVYWAIRLSKTVIGWNDGVRTDRRVSTDRKASMSVKNAVGADKRTRRFQCCRHRAR
jgi:hypothetical protein